MPIFNLASAFDDDIGVRLEQADDLFVGGDRLALKTATLGLPDDPLDQRATVPKLGLPFATVTGSGARATTAPRLDRRRPGSPGSA